MTDHNTSACYRCRGTGTVLENGPFGHLQNMTCPVCNGKGSISGGGDWGLFIGFSAIIFAVILLFAIAGVT